MVTRQKSLKSKPGAMKKKEALINLERDRFGKNLAQLANSSASQSGVERHDGVDNAGDINGKRWVALRHYIQSSMDNDPADRGTAPK